MHCTHLSLPFLISSRYSPQDISEALGARPQQPLAGHEADRRGQKRQRHLQADPGVHQATAKDAEEEGWWLAVGGVGKLHLAASAHFHSPAFFVALQNTPDDILPSLVEIIQRMTEREYIKANDAYLRMAIGNAAWPIGWLAVARGGFAGTSRLLQLSMTRSNPQITGVTNVGIHSRTGREKIFAQHIAHVLNDENQRKYIQVRHRAHPLAALRPHNQHQHPNQNTLPQALKRIMTYAQNKFQTDPSKCLEHKVCLLTRIWTPSSPLANPNANPHPSPLSFSGHSLAAVPEQPR